MDEKEKKDGIKENKSSSVAEVSVPESKEAQEISNKSDTIPKLENEVEDNKSEDKDTIVNKNTTETIKADNVVKNTPNSKNDTINTTSDAEKKTSETTKTTTAQPNPSGKVVKHETSKPSNNIKPEKTKSLKQEEEESETKPTSKPKPRPLLRTELSLSPIKSIHENDNEIDPMRVLFKQTIAIILKSLSISRATTTSLDELTLLAEQYFLDLGDCIHRFSTVQRRKQPSYADVKLGLFMKKIKANNLNKEAIRFETAKLKLNKYNSQFIKTIDKLADKARSSANSKAEGDSFDDDTQSIQEKNPFVEAENTFYEISELIPPTKPRGSAIPDWLPPFPPDHTYLDTPQYTKRISDPRQLREKIVAEGKLGEKALKNLFPQEQQENDEDGTESSDEDSITRANNSLNPNGGNGDHIDLGLGSDTDSDLDDNEFEDVEMRLEDRPSNTELKEDDIFLVGVPPTPVEPQSTIKTRNGNPENPHEIALNIREETPKGYASLGKPKYLQNGKSIDSSDPYGFGLKYTSKKLDIVKYSQTRLTMLKRKKEKEEEEKTKREKDPFLLAAKYLAPNVVVEISQETSNMFSALLEDELTKVLNETKKVTRKKRRRISKENIFL